MISSNAEYPSSSTVPMLPPATNTAGESPCKRDLLKVFRKEDRGVDATVMRHVQRVLVLLVPDDSFLSFSFGNMTVDAALPPQICSTTAPRRNI